MVFHPKHIEASGELRQDMRLCLSLPGELKTGGPGPPKEILGTDSSLEVLDRQGATLDRGDSFSGCSDAVLNLRPVKDTHREITPGFDNHVSLPSKLEVINNPSPSLSRRLAEPVKNFADTVCEEPFEDETTMEVYTSSELLYSPSEIKPSTNSCSPVVGRGQELLESHDALQTTDRHSGFRRSGFRRSGLDIGGLDVWG